MPDQLPWSEVLRRRNGLPPTAGLPLTEAEGAAVLAANLPPGTIVTAALVRQLTEPQPVATEDDPQIVVTDRQAALFADACTVVEVDGTPVAVRGSGDFTTRDQEMFAEVVRAAKRAYEADIAAAEQPEFDVVIRTHRDDLPNLHVRLTEPRCPHDLPTTMCHHCKET